MKKICIINNYIFMFVVFLIMFASNWLLSSYGNITVDELLFHIYVPIKSAEKSLIYSFILKSIIPSLIIAYIVSIVLICIIKEIKKYYYFELKIKFRKRQILINIKRKYILFILFLLKLFFALLIINVSLNQLHIFEYIKEQGTDSKFIENNYVDSKKVSLTFPNKKRNLIYIYIESFESTYFSKEYGGAIDYNLLEPMMNLIEDNIHFSSNEDLGGGALQIYGTGYTSAALVAQTSGLPLKLNGQELNVSYGHKSFLQGAYTLGDILEREGYNQMFMIGSDKQFGNRDVYFTTHGNYKIYDYSTAKKKNKIDKDYYVWWGLEDGKLFDYAKEELAKLGKKEQPFNFTLLTANTHHIGGYLEEWCEEKYDDNYSNVIYYTAVQINEFISWIKNQDFYDNTTIIITGDHLSMDPNYFNNIDSNYQRTVFNLFINSSAATDNINNRSFTTLDMFPTTLASMGVKIDGDKLGLGTNLFSDKKTIIEEYGFNYVDSEFSKRSQYYNKKFVY